MFAWLRRLFVPHQPDPPPHVCTPDCERDAHYARVQQEVRRRLDRVESMIDAASHEWDRTKDQP